MEDVEMNDAIFINEESYQQIKKKMGKEDDYFTEKEIEDYVKITSNNNCQENIKR